MSVDPRTALRRIVLIGLPGSGKSAVARAVAGILGWDAVDCDDLIVEQQGRSIAEIFRCEGEERFRALEARTIERVMEMEQVAVATGGGSVLSPLNRRRLWQDAFVVALAAQPATLLDRMTAMEGVAARPLLSGDAPADRLWALAAERGAVYGLADWTVQTDGFAPEEVAEQVVEAYRRFGERLLRRDNRMAPHEDERAKEEATAPADPDVAATVRTPSGDYAIAVGWGILAGLGKRLRTLGIAGRVHLITDEHVGPLYADAVLRSLAEAEYEAAVYQIRPGEDQKTLAAAESTIDWLVARRAERREAIVALGGGVVTDLAGFVAATFLRGVPLIHVPTSLLGAVDASIGGKVAVDHRSGKNLIGAFYQPRLVLIDAATLQTLPPRELTSGWAEVIKHGLIADESLVSYLESNAAGVRALQPEALLPVLRRSAEIKAAVVSADERESGLRATLNYGHTIGHALEAAEGYTGPLHGEAVAVGMAGVAAIARRMGLLSERDAERQNRLISAYGLPLSWPGADADRIFAAMTLDKKTTGAVVRWVLLEGIGRTVGRTDVPSGLVREVVGDLISGCGAACQRVPVTFDLIAGDSAGPRAGLLGTARGTVPTPVFMPVGTVGSVKGVSPPELRRLGASIILGNTYHLMLRPGVETVRRFGGIARFSSWNGPVLTDSGGYQVFSLGHLREVDDAGVIFRSHIDGSTWRVSPEDAVLLQEALGADILMALDQPSAPGCDHAEVQIATERTHRWAARCLAAHAGAGTLFPICQGGTFVGLRRSSAAAIASLGAQGNAIGGLSLGESKDLTWRMLEASIAELPGDKPRYLMGVGAPDDLLEGVSRGVDMFDCVLPTRLGRNGAVFTADGKLNLRNAASAEVTRPIEEGCDCETCRGYALGYLHHLFHCEELLGYRLASIHNLRFLVRLMEQARRAVLEGCFAGFHDDFRHRYRPPNAETRSEQRRLWRAARSRWSGQTGAGAPTADAEETPAEAGAKD